MEINRASTGERYADEFLSQITKVLLITESEDEFNDALEKWLIDNISEIERDSKNLHMLNEDGISSVLAKGLRTPEIKVEREAHSNGHVDITIEVPNANVPRRKLGEAKIWRHNSYQVSGLKQLIERYSTGRESRGFVISYVKEENIEGKFIALRQYMDKEKSCNLTSPCMDYVKTKWAFLSQHNHSSGSNLEVLHIGCNMFYKKP